MIDVDLIEFATGELGVIADRKLQVFVLYDKDGKALVSWLPEDALDANNKQAEGEAARKTLAMLPTYKLVQRQGYDGFTTAEVELVAKVARQLQESTGQRCRCLAENIIKE